MPVITALKKGHLKTIVKDETFSESVACVWTV